MPHFWRHFTLPRGHVLARNLSNYSRLATKRGHFLETDGLPRIPLKFWKNADNLSWSGDAIFRTLIAARNTPRFWHHFSPPPAGLFRPDIWPIIIIRDYLQKKGSLSETNGLITHDFPKILGNCGQSATTRRAPILKSNRG